MTDSYVIYFCDTETTGLKIECDIIELCFIRLILQDDGNYKEEEKTWLLKCVSPQYIEDQALKINGHDRQHILWMTKYGKENYLEPEKAVSEIEQWIAEDDVSGLDRVWVGQNSKFDIDRVIELFKRNGRTKPEDFPFDFGNGNRIIDTKMLVCLFDMITGRRRKSYSLGQLIKSCKIKKEKSEQLHSAAVDTKLTKNLLLKLISIIKEPVQEKFADCYIEEN